MCVGATSVYLKLRLNKTWRRDCVVNTSVTLMFLNNSEKQPSALSTTWPHYREDGEKVRQGRRGNVCKRRRKEENERSTCCIGSPSRTWIPIRTTNVTTEQTKKEHLNMVYRFSTFHMCFIFYNMPSSKYINEAGTLWLCVSPPVSWMLLLH